MSLIVDDNYYAEAAKWADSQGNDLNHARTQYNSIMKRVIEKGIKKGKTADALQEFVDQALTGNMGKNASNPWKLGVETKGYCLDYVSQIDVADEDLY